MKEDRRWRSTSGSNSVSLLRGKITCRIHENEALVEEIERKEESHRGPSAKEQKTTLLQEEEQ